MEMFDSAGLGKVYAIRIDPGEDFLQSIESFIAQRNIKYGVVLSGIATFSSAVLHMITTTTYPPIEHFENWNDKPLELAAVSGVIANGIPHIHVVVSNRNAAYAGHCHYGCVVLYLCEVVIAEIPDINFHRVKNECGVMQLVQLRVSSIKNVERTTSGESCHHACETRACNITGEGDIHEIV